VKGKGSVPSGFRPLHPHSRSVQESHGDIWENRACLVCYYSCERFLLDNGLGRSMVTRILPLNTTADQKECKQSDCSGFGCHDVSSSPRSFLAPGETQFFECV
jgi:hypothetical protein